MNDALREAAAVDPGWARSEQRKQALLKVVTVGALMAIAVGTFSVVVNFRQETKLTRIEHSACQVAPAGRECQKTKQESARAASVYTTCIPFRKVGYPCPRGKRDDHRDP